MASFSTTIQEPYVTLLKDEEVSNVGKFSCLKLIVTSVLLVLLAITVVALTIYIISQEECVQYSPTGGGSSSSSTSTSSPSPSPLSCKTERGKSMDAPCIFPFRYGGHTFNMCTNMAHHSLWCSTKVDESRKYIGGKWGNCNSQCAIFPTSEWIKMDHTCYKFITEICRKGCSYTEAQGLCAAEGGKLAGPWMEPILNNLSTFAAKSYPGYSWILGLNDRFWEGRFVSESSNAEVALSSGVWARGEPNNAGNEDCVEMEFGGKLYDISCEEPIGMPVCEKDKELC